MPSIPLLFTCLFLGCFLLLTTVPGGYALPRLSTHGAHWVDEQGKQVILRGCNLGNWLIQEMWMHAMRTEGIPDQYRLEQILTQRFGEAKKEALMQTYRANFITARDFATIKSFGMNVVRLPIWYTVLMDDAKPYELKPKAWQEIDQAIDWAEAQGIYTILDLHGAPGGQNPWHHCGREASMGLWGNDEYKKHTIWLWKQIAMRYKDRSAVAGYDLLNEPYTAPRDELKALSLACYDAIREVDKEHIVIFASLGDGFDFYGDLKHLHNVVITPHFYPGFFGWGEPKPEVHLEWLNHGVKDWQKRMDAAGVPALVGEMNVVLQSAGGPEMMRRSFDTYAGFGWATTMWSYKVFSHEGGIGDGAWGMVTNPKGHGRDIDIRRSNYEDIKNYFQSLSTMKYVVYEELREWLTKKAVSEEKRE